jgi:hypothetical protein
MKHGRIAAFAAAIALAAGSGVATVGVGTASAATNETFFCVTDLSSVTWCAVADGSNAIQMKQGIIPGTTTNWIWQSPNVWAPIQQAATAPAKCMQVDHDAGNIVIMANCVSPAPSYQQWFNIAPTGANYVQFESGYGSSAECLTYNASGHDLKIGGCGADWYQDFNPE